MKKESFWRYQKTFQDILSFSGLHSTLIVSEMNFSLDSSAQRESKCSKKCKTLSTILIEVFHSTFECLHTVQLQHYKVVWYRINFERFYFAHICTEGASILVQFLTSPALFVCTIFKCHLRNMHSRIKGPIPVAFWVLFNHTAFDLFTNKYFAAFITLIARIYRPWHVLWK